MPKPPKTRNDEGAESVIIGTGSLTLNTNAPQSPKRIRVKKKRRIGFVTEDDAIARTPEP